ncbi:hypothetical protein MOF52_12135 [Bacillus inaquosorum]|uniref:hypothetical protein n=1 Tax=Bacillus inaquosorum TaxID=483913 RepID=UPI0022828FB9|nr:hypothetical protein [Bacillus inaquosorum]MCY7767970.1 hypothetical protein [Bacillus inaquosorum]MCY8083188.1 hypothetical protein [Bacillus inaquosorum]MCY8169543.1 hypothetical protein [Bacillus inaquosorum]MCY8174912.1 hypothetical protein [Bacillus inaquosorum]MCY8282871.1 hypothetical protein [Bacillus inaquosorum]
MFKKGQKVIVDFTDEIGAVAKVDYRYNQVEVEYPDGTYQVVGFHKIRKVED